MAVCIGKILDRAVQLKRIQSYVLSTSGVDTANYLSNTACHLESSVQLQG